MIARFGCVVEGHGEREAVPILLRRLVARLDNTIQVDVRQTIRQPKSRLLKDGGIEKAVEQASIGLGPNAAIFVVLDSDDDCPADLGPKLLARSLATRGDLSIALVVAKWEFEAWFLAAAASLRGLRGLPQDLEPPPDPEAVQGAKEWLGSRMGPTGYSGPLDQPALTARFDLESARVSASFDKCFREVARVIAEISTWQASAE
jgi:hypothetical protein